MGLFHRTREPVVLKEDSSAEEQLAAMELYMDQVPETKKRELQQDIRNLRYGISGEKEILFELKNSHLPMYALHDIRIESSGERAQIDFYLVTQKVNFVLECKNLYGNIEITEDGRFIRHIPTEGGQKEEGMYSPVTQNEKHVELLREAWRERCGRFRRLFFEQKFESMHQPLIVLTNPKTVLWDKEAPEAVRNQVIRADQLIRLIREYQELSSRTAVSDREMKSMAEEVLSLHSERETDYLKKYRTSGLAAPSVSEAAREEYDFAADRQAARSRKQAGKLTYEMHKTSTGTDPICPNCGSVLVKRNGKYGKFLGCSSYPSCTYTQKLTETSR